MGRARSRPSASTTQGRGGISPGTDSRATTATANTGAPVHQSTWAILGTRLPEFNGYVHHQRDEDSLLRDSRIVGPRRRHQSIRLEHSDLGIHRVAHVMEITLPERRLAPARRANGAPVLDSRWTTLGRIASIAAMLTLIGCVSQGGRLSGTGGGVSVTVELDRSQVAAGNAINGKVTVTNNRSTDAVIALDCGAPAAVEAVIPLPLEPTGRSWAGIQGTFKAFVLTSGTAPGGVPATDPVSVGFQGPCPNGPLEATIAPNASLMANIALSAELVRGLPAPAGSIEI